MESEAFPLGEVSKLAWLRPLVNWGGLVLLILCMAPCIAKAWHGYSQRKLFAGTLRGWGGMIAWTLVMYLMAPLAIIWMTGDKLAWAYFPDGAGVIGAAMFGWLNGAIFSLLTQCAALALEFLQRFRH